MAINYEVLARTFAPRLYYEKSVNPFEDIAPDDMGGMYWRLVENKHPGADFCIQYIVFFHYQRWVPSILDKFSGKLPGEHPNDYVPIFLYFRNNRPEKAVFDVCHYEAIGNVSSEYLPRDEGPVLHIRNFYRGILPLNNTRGYTLLEGDPVQLDAQQLSEWWKGRTSAGSYHEKARLIIKKKLENPFQEITTFRDQIGKLGILFDLIFKMYMGEMTVSADPGQKPTQEYPPHVLKVLKRFEPQDKQAEQDFGQVAQFVKENILEGSKVPPYVAVRDREKGVPY